MKLADKQVYPKVTHGQTEGLTFRERLIVALASNPVVLQDENGKPFVDSGDRYGINAREIVKQADAIIAQLEQETK